jgi:hypothetical protein
MSLIVHVPEAKSGADIHSKRHQMVQLVIDHGLTVRATQDEIMSRYRDDPQAGEGGDGSSPPRSLSGVLKQMANFSTKAMEKLSESFDDISGRLHQTTGDKVNDAVIDTMSSDAEALKKLGEKCREASVTLEREATRLRREKAKAKPAETGNGKTAKKAGGRTPGRSRASS